MSKIKKVFVLVFVGSLFVMCNQKEKKDTNKESILKGSATILVDETLTPIMEDQVAVFESNYEAKIKIVSKSESEIINSLFTEKSGIAVLTRNLTMEENKIFSQKKLLQKSLNLPRMLSLLFQIKVIMIL